MTNSILRSIVDRILTLKSEQDGLTDDIKELYAEAKSNGYDKARLGEVVTILRKKAKDPAGFEERHAILEAYLAELGEGVTHTPAPARVEIIHEISPDHGMAPRGQTSAVADGKRSPRNAGGGHEVAEANAQDGTKTGATGEGLNAVPSDPVAARIDNGPPYDDLEIPAILRRTA